MLTGVKNVIELENDVTSQKNSSEFTSENTRKPHYFEGKILDDSEKTIVGMGIKSGTETVLYLWNDGIFSSALDGLIIDSEQCKPGDVIGCCIHLEVSRTANQIFHQLWFSKNGRVMDQPILLVGKAPISVGLLTNADFKEHLCNEVVQMNFGDHPFEHKIGNPNFFFWVV